MHEKKITFNFDSERLVTDKKVPIKSKGNGRSYRYKRVNVKNPKPFEVVNIVNSVSYVPGQKLTKKEVENLCLNKKWLVEIVKCDRSSRY